MNGKRGTSSPCAGAWSFYTVQPYTPSMIPSGWLLPYNSKTASPLGSLNNCYLRLFVSLWGALQSREAFFYSFTEPVSFHSPSSQVPFLYLKAHTAQLATWMIFLGMSVCST